MKRVDSLVPSDVVGPLNRCRDLRVWLVGDVMLDEYIEGDVERISPEAPVQVVRVSRTSHRLGGAANVAHSLAALGVGVRLCSVVGEDAAGETLIAECHKVNIDTRAVGKVSGRPTTRKVRVLGRHQQLVRMDWETSDAVDLPLGLELLERLEGGEGPHAVVISDYGKGLLRPALISAVVAKGRALGVPVLVDPKNRDLSVYRGATVIKPNLKELGDSVGRALGHAPLPEITVAAREARDQTDADAVVVTMGERGMLIVVRDGEPFLVEGRKREVYDVTGAGDTVIAMLTLGLAAGSSLQTAAQLANTAAGYVVGKFGTATVSAQELSGSLSRVLGVGERENKLLESEEIDTQVALWRLQGRRIVFTNGCFDLFHAGHLEVLRQARKLGDVLVVGVNGDASVRRLKGSGRPLLTQSQRAELLGGLSCVDRVVVFDDDTPRALIEQIAPDVLVKGGDYRPEDIVGSELVSSRGGRVVVIPLVQGESTTAILSRIRGG